ncbi:ThuA domain-containing protein [Pedobacter sp.]|uniref:ThuA domain-containing protein n=1 Tax=Pedobacter sp. TaxID=1411316 RepID=UPI003D7F692F
MNNNPTTTRAFLILAILCCYLSGMTQEKKKLLVFSKTAGFYHESIPVGKAAILKLGQENGFDVDTTTNAGKFTKENLNQYAAVVFLNTTGDVLNNEQQQAFEQFINNGRGFVGVHAATDTEYDWPWYGNLVGAYFSDHPKQQEATLRILNPNTIATKHLPAEWKRKDEWYNFKWMTKDPVNVLISIDESSYDAGKGKMGNNHPMAWYRDFDGGRSFYTELGHTDESYADPLYLQHLLGGIQYAMGLNKMQAP